MGWADWMQVVPTTEEAFELERSVREVSNCDDEEAKDALLCPCETELASIKTA